MLLASSFGYLKVQASPGPVEKLLSVLVSERSALEEDQLEGGEETELVAKEDGIE